MPLDRVDARTQPERRTEQLTMRVELDRDIRADLFDAEVGLGPNGLEEIYFVDLKSPTFQFHIKKSET